MSTNTKLILILVGFFIIACQPKEKPSTREDGLKEGSKLIDEGRYDEAIEYFQNKLKVDGHYHVKLGLASAYAARAGVKIEQIYSFVNVRNLKFENAYLTGLAVDKQTQNLIKSLTSYAAQWEKIPLVSSESREDLGKGLEVLKDEKEQGAHLYAATLRVVLLKSVVHQGVGQWEQVKASKFCSDIIQPYFNWALAVLDNLIFLSRELQGAYPERSDELVEHQRQLKYLQQEAELVPWPRERACF